ncbi:MAG: hypothetical protein GF308_21875 [Candidatus Heimdallarchaeota archaeon]|nr:hypothetical protein [Candidatus Heimdallarchaeota archaeon]
MATATKDSANSFLTEISGEVKTLNLLKNKEEKVTGVRGQLLLNPESIQMLQKEGFTVPEDGTVIYKIACEKIFIWKGADELQEGDVINYGPVFVVSYGGNVPAWQGLPYLCLCADGFISVTAGPREQNGRFSPTQFWRPKDVPNQEPTETIQSEQPATAKTTSNKPEKKPEEPRNAPQTKAKRTRKPQQKQTVQPQVTSPMESREPINEELIEQLANAAKILLRTAKDLYLEVQVVKELKEIRKKELKEFAATINDCNWSVVDAMVQFELANQEKKSQR